jgi:hypothetical protein
VSTHFYPYALCYLSHNLAAINPSITNNLTTKLATRTAILDTRSQHIGAMKPTRPYIYSPLRQDTKEVRLLAIHPSIDRDGPVCCALTSVPLSSAGPFKALSYVWGDPTSTSKLCIDGAELEITRNLAIALRYIRHSTETQVFWIDGICINQADMSERSEQVLLMAEIYRQADRVVAWLGEEENDSSVAMNMLSKLADVWLDYRDHNINPGRGLNGISNAFELAIWTAIRHIFMRAWWTRLWIYQEVILARSITLSCGQDTLDWEDLANVYRLLASLLSPQNALYLGPVDTGPVLIVAEMTNWTTLVVNRAWSTQVQSNMLHLLRSCSTRQSTDPRDRFYAVLGLASDARNFGKPSYTIPAEEVFENFTQKIMNQGQSLELLSYARSALITPEEGISCLISLFYHLGCPTGIVEQKISGSIRIGIKLEHRSNQTFTSNQGHFLSMESWQTRSERS